MRFNSSSYVAWLALFVAFALWGATGYLLWSVYELNSSTASAAVAEEEEALRLAADLRLRTLARETQEERNQLGAITNVGIVRMLETVEAVGTDAGVTVRIGQVLAERAQTENSLHGISLAVEAYGSFSELVHALALLETLPIPSNVYDASLRYIPPGENSASQWALTARMKLFTAADLTT